MFEGQIKPKIATLGSHSALQILKGARDEGFETILLCPKDRLNVYNSYNLADTTIELGNFADYNNFEQLLLEQNAVIIPHGSFVEYTSLERLEESIKGFRGASAGGHKKAAAGRVMRTDFGKWKKNLLEIAGK